MKRACSIATILFCSGLLVACEQRLVERNGNNLPSDLEIPTVSGDAKAVATAICEWSERNQLSFSNSDIEGVYVDSVVGPDGGRYIVGDLLRVFIQYEHNPTRLVLPVELERTDFGTLTPNDPAALIDQSGIWEFRKIDLDQCDVSEPHRMQTEWSGRQFCLEVRRHEAPPEGMVRADFRALYYRVPVGWLRAEQPVSVRVLSLYREGTLIGRSMDTDVYAGPLDAGRTNRNCLPTVTPVAFESVASTM